MVRVSGRFEAAESSEDWWMLKAACRGMDTELFLPSTLSTVEQKKSQEVAKKICDGCIVMEQCLAYAIDLNMLGVWGGRTDKERAKLPKEDKAYLVGRYRNPEDKTSAYDNGVAQKEPAYAKMSKRIEGEEEKDRLFRLENEVFSSGQAAEFDSHAKKHFEYIEKNNRESHYSVFAGDNARRMDRSLLFLLISMGRPVYIDEIPALVNEKMQLDHSMDEQDIYKSVIGSLKRIVNFFEFYKRKDPIFARKLVTRIERQAGKKRHSISIN